jgi:serine/threonine protein kinase
MSLVLEYAPFYNLENFLCRLTSIAEPLARVWILQILTIVSFIHSKGFIHGALKLQDFVLTGDLNLKLVGFGTAVNDPSDALKTKEVASVRDIINLLCRCISGD